MSLAPSEKAYVPFVSVEHMMKLAHHIGIETMLAGLASYIEADFRRWQLFDKTPRIASHSAEGVIELMPTSDGEVYGFKYVNGHPRNTQAGLQTVTAFGLLANVGNGYPVLLSEMTVLTALRTAATSGMVARHLAPKGQPHDGDDRRRRAVRIPEPRHEGAGGRDIGAALRHRFGGDGKGRAQPRGHGADGGALRFGRGGDGRRADHHHLHRRQAIRHHPDRQHGGVRRAYQRDRRRLPGQDRTGPGDPAPRRDLRGIPRADPNRGRDPAARPRPSGHGNVAGARRRGTGAHAARIRSRSSTVSASPSRTFPRYATSATISAAPTITATSTSSPTPTIRATSSAC